MRDVEGLDRDPQPVTRQDLRAGREDLDVDRRDLARSGSFACAALVNGWYGWISLPSR